MVKGGCGGVGPLRGTCGGGRCVFACHPSVVNRVSRMQLFADSETSQIFRQLNSVSVPKFVGVPKNDEEDAKRGNQ